MSAIYYLWIEDKQVGPYTIGQLKGLWASGSITMQTLHWREGWKEWKPLGVFLEETAATGEKLDNWSSFQFCLLIVGTAIMPLIGLIVGLIALSNPLKRQRALSLIGMAILFAFLEYWIFTNAF